MIGVCPECAGRVPDPLSEFTDRCHEHLLDLREADDALVDMPLLVPTLTAADESAVSREFCRVLHRRDHAEPE